MSAAGPGTQRQLLLPHITTTSDCEDSNCAHCMQTLGLRVCCFALDELVCKCSFTAGTKLEQNFWETSILSNKKIREKFEKSGRLPLLTNGITLMMIYTDSTFNNLNQIRSKSIKKKKTFNNYEIFLQIYQFNLFEAFIH